MGKIKKIIGKAKDNLTYHLADSTAILAESTPVFAAIETGMAGMSQEVSINARLFAGGLAYAGLGFVYGKGRDLWRKMFNVSQQSKEKIQGICDFAYAATFNSIAGPVIYYASGSRDLKEILIGTACGIGFGAANAYFIGYSIDAFRDLVGLKDCKRDSYPAVVKNMGKNKKKSLAAILVASSIALTAGVYSLTTDNQTPQISHPQETQKAN